jgi:hypothetical protein
MINQDVILLIMNCKKYIWKADIQRSTWLKNIPANLKIYHVIGDEKLETEYNFNNEDNILYVNTPDDYNSLPNKVITAYKAINDTFTFKYIFKTDDDQQLMNDKFLGTLINLLTTKKPQSHYGGHIVKVNNPYISQYYKLHPELPETLVINPTTYCSGRFYFLSSKAVEYLINKRENIVKEFLEDYSIGYYLHDYFKSTILKLDTNTIFKDIPS